MNQNKTTGNGWIIYNGTEESPAPGYIDLYQKACKKYGMTIELGFYDLDSAVLTIGQRHAIKLSNIDEKPSYVVNRTRDYRFAEKLEALGIRVFNSSRIAELGNDKAKAYRYMKQREIPILPTMYEEKETLDWYPAVVKSCSGHGGTQVFLIRDEASWQEWRQKVHFTKGIKDSYVIQQMASEPGKDLRVYVVGDRIVASVLRTSKEDFRSNFCLGGKVQLYELSKEERALVERAICGLSIGMAGIDFVFHHGEMVFNEIEDMVGARGLYSLTDYDIVDEYVRFIWEELRNEEAGKSTDL